MEKRVADVTGPHAGSVEWGEFWRLADAGVRNLHHDSAGILECTSQIPMVQEIGDFCGRMVVQELPRDSCSLEHASTFHGKNLSSRISVIFILNCVA